MSNTSTPANFLKRQDLAFHHGLAGERADRAEAKDGGAVGDHGDEIAAGGELVGLARVALDRCAGGGAAGRIGERQVALVGQALGRQDRDFPGVGRRW
jgi:hypothetical protein